MAGPQGRGLAFACRAIFLWALVCPGLQAQSTVSTWRAGYNGGSPGGAIYFDLDAEAGLTVRQVGLHLDGGMIGAGGTAQIFRCAGSHVGLEASPSAWTQVATGSLQYFGAGQWSILNLQTNPWVLPAGRQGIAIVVPGLQHRYDNLPPSHAGVFASDELRIFTGAASNVPFAAPVFAGRVPNVSIAYDDPGPGFARQAILGNGCGDRPASIYEAFSRPVDFDLSNTSFRLLPVGGGYEVVSGVGSWRAPSAAAVSLGLVDESAATCAFQGTFRYPGGSTSSFEVGSNGTVSVGHNPLDGQVMVTRFLSQPHACWGVWRDFVPTSLGNVWFEQVGTSVHITYLGVFAWLGHLLDFTPSSFQLQFDTQNDSVTFVFGTMSQMVGAVWSGHSAYIVGYSPGGVSLDPGPIDWSALPASYRTVGQDLPAPRLWLSGRPVQASTQQFSLDIVSNTALVAGIVFGLVNPGLDLSSLGMPGCVQHVSPLATTLLPLGGTSPPAVSWVVPNALGTAIYTQAFVLDPAAGVNPAGVLASRGLRLWIGGF